MLLATLLMVHAAHITKAFVAPGTVFKNRQFARNVESASDSTRIFALKTLDATTEMTSFSVEAVNIVKSSFVDSSFILAETEPWVQPVAAVLDPTLNFLAFAMLCRVVISWYPNQNINEFPFNLVSWPTEPLLKLIRGAIPPAFGVDITPIVWFGIFTFCHEIFLGQQGLFTMKIKYGM